MIWNNFKAEGRMKKEDVVQIIQLAKTILQKEPNVLDIQDPVTVVGDIHG